MPIYGIKRMDTNEVLPRPYRYDSMTEAEVEIYRIKEIFIMLGKFSESPQMEVIWLEGEE
jgi:hypothetical protein